jgi:hypothetical protein
MLTILDPHSDHGVYMSVKHASPDLSPHFHGLPTLLNLQKGVPMFCDKVSFSITTQFRLTIPHIDHRRYTCRLIITIFSIPDPKGPSSVHSSSVNCSHFNLFLWNYFANWNQTFQVRCLEDPLQIILISFSSDKNMADSRILVSVGKANIHPKKIMLKYFANWNQPW